MKLHDILYGIGFVTGLIGISGIGGVIEKGTGLVASIFLLAVCAITMTAALKEDGVLRKKDRPR